MNSGTSVEGAGELMADSCFHRLPPSKTGAASGFRKKERKGKERDEVAGGVTYLPNIYNVHFAKGNNFEGKINSKSQLKQLLLFAGCNSFML